MTISSRHTARAEALEPEDRARIAQQIRRRGGYHFPSAKTKASVACVTALHRDLACHLEVDEAISEFEAHPERVVHSVGGEVRVHVPSFRAKGRGRTYVLDVVQDDSDVDAVDAEFACTLKSFASEVLHALEHPDFDSGTLTIKTTRIAETIKNNGVRLLVVDEVQRLIDVDADKVQHDVSTWLTAFLNKRVCPLLLVGEQRAVELFEGNYIRVRTMGEVWVGAYDWAGEVERNEFRHFLSGLDGNLGLPEPSGFHADLAYSIHQHAQGLLGLAAQLVTQARLVAWREERPRLTLDLFAEAVDMLRIGETRSPGNPFRDALENLRTHEEQVAAVMAKGSRRRAKR